MNRTGLVIALLVGAVAGVVFGIYPQLDLALSRPFFHPELGFVPRYDPAWLKARSAGIRIPTAIAVLTTAALVWKLLLPRRRLLIPGRAIVLLLSTLALAPGLVTNVILKDNWGRPRPIDVTEFKGDEHFVPWWDPRGDCLKNCSFTAGEPSGAAWTMAAAAVTPLPWRPFAYAASLVFTLAVGFVRLAAGGHFASDIAFAGVLTFLIIWVVHGLLYRWPATRITDERIEGAIERIAMPGYTALERLFARLRGKPKSL